VAVPIDNGRKLVAHLRNFARTQVTQDLTVYPYDHWVHNASETDGGLGKKQITEQNRQLIVKFFVDSRLPTARRRCIDYIVMDQGSRVNKFGQNSQDNVQAGKLAMGQVNILVSKTGPG